MAGQVAVVGTQDDALALHREGNGLIRAEDEVASLVLGLQGQQYTLARPGRTGLLEGQLGRRAGGHDGLRAYGLAADIARGDQPARHVGDEAPQHAVGVAAALIQNQHLGAVVDDDPLAVGGRHDRQHCPADLRIVPQLLVGGHAPVLLGEFVRQGVVQQAHPHHRFLRPDGLQNMVAEAGHVVGAEDGARPALGGPAHGFAQVVKARPDEAADDVAAPLRHQGGQALHVVLHVVPVPHEVLVDLRAQNQLVRVGGVDGLVPLLLVVAGDDVHLRGNLADAGHALVHILDLPLVHLIHKGLDVLHLGKVDLRRTLEVGVHGVGHGAGGVQRMGPGYQHPKRFQHGGQGLVLHLVAHAPDHHAGPVAVAGDHGIQIMLPVPVEVAPVQAAVPFVEALLIDIEAHLVAQIHELLGVDMVRGANGVAAHLLQQRKTLPPLLGGNRHAHGGEVLMQTHAPQHLRLPVDPHAVAAEGHLPQAQPAGVYIRDLAVRHQRQGQRAQRGRRSRPQRRVRHRQGDFPAAITAYHASVGEGQLRLYADPLPGHNPQGGIPAGQDGGQHDAAGIQVMARHAHQLYRAVDAAAAVPAVGRLGGVVHPHHKLIFTRMHKGCHVQLEGRVAVALSAGLLTVDPHGAVLIHAAEVQPYALVPVKSIQGDDALVPAHVITVEEALGHFPEGIVPGAGNLPPDHPVMGKRNGFVTALRGAILLPEGKLPSVLKRHFQPVHCTCSCSLVVMERRASFILQSFRGGGSLRAGGISPGCSRAARYPCACRDHTKAEKPCSSAFAA